MNGRIKGMRILAAEDDPTEAFLLKRAFLRAGIDVPLDFVADGQQVIDYLAGQEPFSDRASHPMPTLLLLDLKMPRVDGFQVIEWLRQQPVLGRLPVVVLTNSDLAEDVTRAFDLGANSYLQKPHDMPALEDLVRLLEQYWIETNRPPATLPSEDP